MLSLRLMVADEETIILRRFDVSASDVAANDDCCAAGELEDAGNLRAPARGAASAGGELAVGNAENGLSVSGTAGALAAATTDAALALTGSATAIRGASLSWCTRSSTSPHTSRLGLTMNSMKP